MPVPVRFRYATGLVKQYGRYQTLHGLDLEVRPGEVFGFLRRPRNRRRRGGRHLDLLLAHPVSRTRLVLERFAALAAAVAWLGLVVWAGTLAAARAADMGIGAGRSPPPHWAWSCSAWASARSRWPPAP
jgi:hypothetical protein